MDLADLVARVVNTEAAEPERGALPRKALIGCPHCERGAAMLSRSSRPRRLH
jgi:hypothetical protein